MDERESMPGAGALIADKYRVDRVLGEGGMGVVLAATHTELDRRVAIKVVRAELAQNEQVVARMLVEARAAARIRSEHVAAVLDVGRLPTGVPFIVMEYLDGTDLGRLIQTSGPLSLSDAIDYVLQACEVLAEAHGAQIIHRDLKPENLFLTQRADGSPLIKVLDFGISKNLGTASRTSALTNPSSAVGTPYYMSPEQMMSARDVDARTDIYALGAILFELVSGRPPFDADTLPTVCAMVLNTPAPHLSERVADIPQAADEAIHRCLLKNPHERFDNVGELARVLSPFGSRSASRSMERITGVIAGGKGTPPAGVGNTLMLAHTEPAFVAATPGEIERPKSRSVGKWVVGFGVAGLVLAAGIFGLAFRGGASAVEPSALGSGSEPSANVSPVPAAQPEILPAPPSAQPPENRQEPQLADAGAADAKSAVDGETPKAPPILAPKPPPKPVARPRPKPVDKAPKPGPTADPFDPNAFGGRH